MMAKRPALVPITRRALITRVNRKLAENDEQLMVTRGDTPKIAIGDFWVRDNHKNCVIGKHIDLEEFARKIGVLADYEKLEDE